MLYYQMTGFMEGDRPEPDYALRLPAPEDAALFLDFDGTLLDIAATPDEIIVPEDLPALLTRAMDRLDGRVALVTGRNVAGLEHFLPSFDGAVIAAHGAELRVDGKTFQAGDYDTDTIAGLQRVVAEFAKLQPAFLVENKPTGVVLHYRQAQEQGALALHFMDSLAQAAPGFRLQPALCAYEIKPDSVAKDLALADMMARAPFKGKLPIYAGDDLTDEPALSWADAAGGVAIKVGGADTVAPHWLADPTALRALLARWLA
ncbi:trehalose-phosphatase [Jannaschia seohaensis]|uniref:Trehalose 6-phosphate phosphatase n=1 Tax=Jannaschia seohaensis TaxID=475081 RepID=A0A2Y9A5F5_9RHOB|nr:trehalose-phosphatase [Jannaschia seohaensis]PWJ22390.1 trehalose 6-phosphate phosphatase [Jannaschia seohaensis]SSA38668.1 trehalose 6-phosphate phosphatase [Jannaschia seohaensis]